MKFMLIRLVMAGVWISAAYKWGDLKNWKNYYPSMLFFGFGDMIYSLVFHDNLLWEFQTKFLVPPLNELFVIFFIFFPSILLYLSNYPKRFSYKVVYILSWIVIYMSIEIVTLFIGLIKYYNGWNLWWSLLHNSIQFPVLRLHHKNPTLAWAISFVFLVIIMHIFHMPFLIGK